MKLQQLETNERTKTIYMIFNNVNGDEVLVDIILNLERNRKVIKISYYKDEAKEVVEGRIQFASMKSFKEACNDLKEIFK